MKPLSALVTIVIGTRPEAIKLAPVIKEFKSKKYIDVRIVLTGQHKELVEEVLKVFEINYNLDLGLMSVNQTLQHITIKTIEGLEKEFNSYQPDLLIIQGDTTSAFVASLSAFYKKIPIAHVEAGLRTNYIYDPYPEEVNRRLISQMACLNFAPTTRSKENLVKSNIDGKIVITGNTVIDALLEASPKAPNIEFFKEKNSDYRLILLTVHRRENIGKRLENIVKGILSIVNSNNNVRFLIPMHPNPKVRITFKNFLDNIQQIKLCEPLSYLEMISAMKQSYFIMTDSGGIQEEAPSLEKPVLILRNTTERPEGVESGAARLIGTDSERIFIETNKLLEDSNLYQLMSSASNPYGDGKSSRRIVDVCLKQIQENEFLKM